MSEPFVSEIRMMAFTYPPRGWAYCDGAELAIAQQQVLFSLIGNTYGGNGISTFRLPDLRGRAPMHVGTGYARGQTGGEAEHTLTLAEVPGTHTHPAYAASADATGVRPTDAVLAGGTDIYRSPRSDPEPTTLSAQALSSAGGQPHPNMQPFLAVPFCIALEGLYPQRS